MKAKLQEHLDYLWHGLDMLAAVCLIVLGIVVGLGLLIAGMKTFPYTCSILVLLVASYIAGRVTFQEDTGFTIKLFRWGSRKRHS